MRISTKLATGLMGVGVLAVSYQLGATADTGMSLTASDANSTTSGGTVSLTGETTPSPVATPTPSATATTAPAKKQTTPKPKATSTPKATTPPATTGGTTTTTSLAGTKTGALVQEPRWGGYVQVSVTKDASGKITAINLVQAVATGGRQGAFSVLQSAALQAQGSNFGNVSRATYTTDAFKQALDSALAKF